MPTQEIEVEFVYSSQEKMKNFSSQRQWWQVTTLDAEAIDHVLSSQQTKWLNLSKLKQYILHHYQKVVSFW